MDIALSPSLSIHQLKSLNRARIHFRKIYVFQEDTYSDVPWPNRAISKNDLSLYTCFVTNHQCGLSNPLHKGYQFPKLTIHHFYPLAETLINQAKTQYI